MLFILSGPRLFLLDGIAPEKAVIEPLPRRSVIMPEKQYSTIACSTKDSKHCRTETAAITDRPELLRASGAAPEATAT